MALAMAAAVGAATAVPIEAAVGGVSVVTVAVGKDTGKGLVSAEATADPIAVAVTGVGGVSVVTVAAGSTTGHAFAAVLGAPCAVSDVIEADATATVGGLETTAEAMAAAVGAATAVPMAAAVGGVRLVTVALGSETGRGLVSAEDTALPIAAAVTGVGGVSVVTVAEGKETGRGLAKAAAMAAAVGGRLPEANVTLGRAATVTWSADVSARTFRLPLPSRAAGSCVLLTGCVVWYAPLTGTVPEMATVPETGCVAGRLLTLTEPDTGCVTPEPFTKSG